MPGLELRYNNPGWSYAATASVWCLVSTGQRGCAGRENGLLGLCPGLNAVGGASTTGEQTKAIHLPGSTLWEMPQPQGSNGYEVASRLKGVKTGKG